MERPKKVLLVGWDGATWDYINPLLEQGRLPNLALLKGRGASGTLRSTVPPYTHIAWPALVTGMGPAKTGVFEGAKPLKNSYEGVSSSLAGFNGMPIWDWLNHHELRTAVLNVPMTYPAKPIDGYMVTGFDSPKESDAVAFLKSLLEQWRQQGRQYQVLAEEIALMDSQNPHQPRRDLFQFVTRWSALTEQQGEFAAWLWQEWPVDFMFIVFSGTDSINHRTHNRTYISQVYEAADKALGTLLEATDEQTMVVLVSDHGSTPAHRYVSLNRILHEAGWLRFKPQVADRSWRKLPGQTGAVVQHVWKRLPHFLRRIVSWPLLKLDPRLAVAYGNIDWSQTSVFARSGMGPLYINRSGRWPSGIVTNEQHDELRSHILTHLEALDDDEGKKLFEKVFRGDECYPNARQEDAPPDLVFQPGDWSDHVITGFVSDPIARGIPSDREYGTHTPEGILVLAGPNIKPRADLEQRDIVDVVPTVLAAWQLPLLKDMDGEVI
jgi:predicted AlkP superfamily phosphohydrolase/phosphomutase